MHEIRTFNHEMFGDIRTMTDEKGETFFVGNDVARALGYSNVRDALIRHVEADDKGVVKSDTLGGFQAMTIINESGLYSLVLSSKRPQARVFKHWVTSEVLPQIRKTGGYIPAKDASGGKLSDVEVMSLALQILQKTIEMQELQIEDMAPKADYCDEVLESVSCFTTTQIAKELDMTVHDLTRLLMEWKVMYKQSGQYLLYADFARKGYARNRTHSHYDGEGELHTRTYLVWTERGRKMIHRMCKTREVMIPFMLSVEMNDEEDEQ